MQQAENRGLAPAGYFDSHYRDRDWESYRRLLAVVVQHAPPGPILDLGAGAGYFVEVARRWNIECVGLEGSSEGLDRSRLRSDTLDVRHHLLSQPLPFGSESFATVVLNQVIEHLGEEIAGFTLAQAHRVLWPGGLLVVMSPSKFNRADATADPTHHRLYSPSELRMLLERAGFDRVESMDSPLPIFGRSQLGWALAVGAFRLLGIERLSATANCLAFKPV